MTATLDEMNAIIEGCQARSDALLVKVRKEPFSIAAFEWRKKIEVEGDTIEMVSAEIDHHFG